MTGGFGNKRGPKSSSDYEREWNTFQFGMLAILAFVLLLYACSRV